MSSSERTTPTDTRVPAEAASTKTPRVPAPKVEWTVMIFMVGDNNLSDQAVADLHEIKEAGSSEDVTVIVQADLKRSEGTTKRYRITRDRTLEEDVDAQWRETRPEVLKYFVEWCIESHPAEHYMLLLWGHGRALDSFEVPAAVPVETDNEHVRQAVVRRRDERYSRRKKAPDATQEGKPFFIICPDDQAKHAISNMELKAILEEVSDKIPGGKIHVLGMVACLMGMFEMCYELRHGVHYMIASESLIPDTSLPFDKVIPFLIQNPKVQPEEVCRTVVDMFKTYYVKNDELPVQLSAFDLTKADELRTNIDDLARMLKAQIEAGDKDALNAVLGSHFQTQRYDEDQFFDLYDFCYMLKENCTNKEISDLCQLIMDGIGSEKQPNFVIASKFNGAAMQFSYGLAIYFPWGGLNAVRYRTLDFTRSASSNEPDSPWLDFLTTYVDRITKFDRDSRDEEGLQESAATA